MFCQTLSLTVALAFAMTVASSALDRWAALSQIETGDKDTVVGAQGEISRYQLLPDVWHRYASTNADWQKPEDALAVAQKVMGERISAFTNTYHRAPTDFEFYVLWNAPAQIEHPSPAVQERAERFCNLVTSTGALTAGIEKPGTTTLGK